MPTSIPIGSPLARRVYGAAVFADTQRKPSFRKNLTGPAPKQGSAESKLRGQSSQDFPFVRVNDLEKTAGDTVTVDTFNIIQGKPVMGDAKIAGKMMALTFDSMDVSIDQYRGGVDSGGRMTQKRTVHNLRGIAKANLAGYFSRLEDQLCLTHVAGARGFEAGGDWVVPMETDPDFANIAVNAVNPPTFNRRFLAGTATSVANLATTDFLTLTDIDRIRAQIDEMPFPLQPIRIDGDADSDENPLFCLYVTSRQWHYLQTNTSAQNWRTFISNAHARSDGFNHPLFRGTPGMWNGILIKKMGRSVRFPAGSSVREYTLAGLITPAVCAVDTDRAVLLGAQALAEVYGRHGKSGHQADWSEIEVDHGNSVETVAAFMGGKSKIRFNDIDGVLTDHGVITIDSYAPAVTV